MLTFSEIMSQVMKHGVPVQFPKYIVVLYVEGAITAKSHRVLT